MPNAPRWIANITARYAIPFRDGEFYAYTDWAYRSKINFFPYRLVEFTDDKLLEGGLRLKATPRRRRVGCGGAGRTSSTTKAWKAASTSTT